jgi:hypothetical protein
MRTSRKQTSAAGSGVHLVRPGATGQVFTATPGANARRAGERADQRRWMTASAPWTAFPSSDHVRSDVNPLAHKPARSPVAVPAEVADAFGRSGRHGGQAGVPGGNPQTSQCVKVPPGASGPGISMATSWVPDGALHCRRGSRFAPSQVNSRGNAPRARSGLETVSGRNLPVWSRSLPNLHIRSAAVWARLGRAHRAGLRSGRRQAGVRANRPGEQCEFPYPS